MTLLTLLRQFPAGSLVPAGWVVEQLEGEEENEPQPEIDPEPVPQTWREKLWIVPGETRIGVHELAEALGRPRSWIYRHTSAKAAEAAGYSLIPHRKMDGELVFLVGELRAWIRDTEEVIQAGRMESTSQERRGWRVA